MNKKELIILTVTLVVSIVLFVCYRLGYIHFYVSKDYVYGQVIQIDDNYVEIKSLKTSGGLSKNEVVNIPTSGEFRILIDSFEVGDKLKFKITSINKDVIPAEIVAKSIELIN